MFSFKSFTKSAVLTLFFYLVWLVFYQFFLLPRTYFDEYLIHILVILSGSVLHALGFTVSHNNGGFYHTLRIDDVGGVWISPNCDGLSVVAVFVIVLLSFPGDRKRLLYFFPIGAVIIELVNVFRIVCLSIVQRYYPTWLKFNHDYTFTIIVYGMVIGLWWWWFTRYPKWKAK
jgi:exosortase/archaeosortase family protein